MDIKASFAKIDYTPEIGLKFGRLGANVHVAEGVHSPLFARQMLLSDEDSVFGITILDQGLLRESVVAEFREVMSEVTGAPAENFLFAATHTHNAPAAFVWHDEGKDLAYIKLLKENLAWLTETNLRKVKSVVFKVGQIDAPGFSINRRSIYRMEDGREQVGTHGPRSGEDFSGLEGEDEKDLQVLEAFDDSGALIGGIVNFACHPTKMYSSKCFSADYPGILCEELERKRGGTFVFANGACGDLGPNPKVSCESMGKILAEEAVQASKESQEVTSTFLRSEKRVLSIPQRRVSHRQLEIAENYLNSENPEDLDKTLAQELWGYEFHFHNPSPVINRWLASDVIGMWEWQRRTGEINPSEEVEIQVVSVGEIAFVGLPGEFFSVFGHEIKDKSPFKHTFIIELANGWHGYIPTKEAFEHGGYETCLSFINRLIPEAGEIMTRNAIELLNETKQK